MMCLFGHGRKNNRDKKGWPLLTSSQMLESFVCGVKAIGPDFHTGTFSTISKAKLLINPWVDGEICSGHHNALIFVIFLLHSVGHLHCSHHFFIHLTPLCYCIGSFTQGKNSNTFCTTVKWLIVCTSSFRSCKNVAMISSTFGNSHIKVHSNSHSANCRQQHSLNVTVSPPVVADLCVNCCFIL